MLEIKLILCPIDFSEFSIRAYHHALSLAEHYRAKLVAQHVLELSRYPYADYVASTGDYAEFCRALREGGKERLQEFVKKHIHGEIRPELVVHEGAAPDSILSFAQTRKTDLIVMGTHGRRGYDRVVLGSVTNRVMRRAPCPVLAVCKPSRDSSAAGEEPGHVHHLSRILFCTDFSENSERALDYAVSATVEYDAELTLLHVLEDVPSPTKTEQAIATATERLNKLIPQEGRRTLKIKTAVRVGKPYQQIIQLAQEAQIDMVVMGVRGRGALDLAVFGSTTYRVLQLGPCPVLAVHL
ncbi:MAG TPA: universal stress protein [Candidatus Sulfotelmatobacter sp.]|jgi:nucleotide-binding universal stress UspA family protein|nr:universal stress protein [Candidatus Sulfotelmatobacter sp.]